MKLLAIFILVSLVLAAYMIGRLFRSDWVDSFYYGKKDFPDDTDDT